MEVGEIAPIVFHGLDSGSGVCPHQTFGFLTIISGLSSKNQETVDRLGSNGPANRPIKILFYGPVGAGKSSFINSVQSALRNKMHNQRAVGTIGGRSFTRGVRDGATKQMFPITDRKDRWRKL